MDNLDFWLAAGGMTLGVTGLLILSARAGARSARIASTPGAEAAPADLQVYRDQLRDVQLDLARGSLPAAEAERLRIEIARRLLEADRKIREQRPAVAQKGGLLVAVGAIVLAGAAALLSYDRLGLPGYPDMPLKQRLAEADQMMAMRPSQADYLRGITQPTLAPPDAEYLELMTKLRAAVDPATATDLRGLELLAHNEAALGNFPPAIAAQTRLIALKAEEATATDHTLLAELLIRQAQGYVSPEADAALAAALQHNPKEGLALYYSGLMFAQSGRFDRSFLLWRNVLEQGPADAPWVAAARAQMPEVAARAGVDYELPPAADVAAPSQSLNADGTALAGPDQAAIDAAAGLSAQDRAAMVEGMVAQLSQRLAQDGGSAAEWAQLIRALAVLDRQPEAENIAQEAREIFAQSPADLAVIDAAVSAAGVRP